MAFYLPRRHRRKLLFPPGLLALAGLLWLGCVAVGGHADRLKFRGVLQLMMPELHCCKDVMSIPEMLEQTGKVDTFRPWHSFKFTGNTRHDLLQQAKITETVRAIIADSTHDGGVRIKFMPTARYSSLVFLLDLMYRESVAKYWLDVKHSPTTFYVLTYKRLR